MSDIKVNIVGEFDKRGFDAADKATGKLGKSFDKLAKRLGAALTIGALAKFSKAAITAFAEDDKAAKQLTQTYKNLGLAFEGAIVNDYVDQLQRATGVADSELRPALSTLTRATLDYGKAQSLLGTAMDVSAATGIDLATVSKALAKAQLGQMSALARLGIGITATEAKTLSFDDAITRLNVKFKGSAAVAAESYQGKINRLKIAADEAKESLGKDLVFAIGKLSGDMSLTTIGDKFQQMADNAGKIAIGIASVIGELNKTPAGAQSGGWIDKFNSFMDKFNVFQYLKNKGALELTLATSAPSRGGAPGAQRLANENLKILEAQRAEQAKILAIQKAQAAEQAKQKRLKQIALMLTQKEARFDLQRIQLAAAAQGKLTADERNRIEQLQTIEDLKAAVAADDLTTAEALLKRLETLQSKTETLAYDLTELKAGDPFSEWDKYFASANKLVNDLFTNFKNQTNVLNDLSNSIKTSRDAANAAVLAAKTDKATAYAQASQASAVSAAIATSDAAAAITAATAAVNAATTPAEAASAQDWLTAANASAEAAATLTESLSAADLATALAELSLANEYLNQSIEAGIGAGVPVSNIYVTVEGSVTAAQDLAEIITDIQYEYQKNGKGLRFSSIAI